MAIIERIIPLLIKITQESVLNWFGIVDQKRYVDPTYRALGINTDHIPDDPAFSKETFQLVTKGLYIKFRSGLSFHEIEDVLIFLILIRFIFLIFRYNLSTSIAITLISVGATILWYRHFNTLCHTYRQAMYMNRATKALAIEAKRLREANKLIRTYGIAYEQGYNNPLATIKTAFVKGSIYGDYRIDPISMLIAKIPQDWKWRTQVDDIYYSIYTRIIPVSYKWIIKQAKAFRGIIAYIYCTRIKKKYCPYFIRWHWTFITLVDFVERPIGVISYRFLYLYEYVLIPEIKSMYSYQITKRVRDELFLAKTISVSIMLAHFTVILLAIFHAIFGQYFYVPFLTENTELHIGRRDVKSVYSGGYTSWQDEEVRRRNKYRFMPEMWYGWFGRGTKESIINEFPGVRQLRRFIRRYRRKFLRRLLQFFNL